MSAESRSHLDKSFQRRFLQVFLVVSALVILLAIPLVAKPELRLEIAHRFDLVPGADIEKMAGRNDGVDLIVAPVEIQRTSNRPQYRFRAIYLARETSGGITLTSVDTGDTISLPLESYDFVSAAPDATKLLFQDRRDPAAVRGVMVDVASGSVAEMSTESPFPPLAGDWTAPVWSRTMGTCDGISPNAKYIACFQNPKLASYLAGDWELQVRVYGDVERKTAVYRGEGFRPFVGWSGDDRWLYFQNEEGIWRAEILDSMFPPSTLRS